VNNVDKKRKGLERAQRYQQKHPDRVRAQQIKRTYGLEWEQYLEMFTNQQGNCKICKVPLSLYPKQREHEIAHVDHCHSTGKVRGLLCKSCNSGLGYFKESPLLFKLAAEYLEEVN